MRDAGEGAGDSGGAALRRGARTDRRERCVVFEEREQRVDPRLRLLAQRCGGHRAEHTGARGSRFACGIGEQFLNRRIARQWRERFGCARDFRAVKICERRAPFGMPARDPLRRAAQFRRVGIQPLRKVRGLQFWIAELIERDECGALRGGFSAPKRRAHRRTVVDFDERVDDGMFERTIIGAHRAEQHRGCAFRPAQPTQRLGGGAGNGGIFPIEQRDELFCRSFVTPRSGRHRSRLRHAIVCVIERYAHGLARGGGINPRERPDDLWVVCRAAELRHDFITAPREFFDAAFAHGGNVH